MINNFLFDSLLIDDYNIFVEKLYNFSSLIDVKNTKGESLLHFSCFYGIIDKYYALINFEAKKNLTNAKDNILHYACFSGNDDFLIVELVKSDINLMERNNEGESVIHLCSNERISHYLNLWCQRNKIKPQDLRDNSGNTILHTSYKYGFNKTVDYWDKSFPELKYIKNKEDQLWNQVLNQTKNFCKG